MENKSRIGVFFSRQEAGLSPAGSSNGNTPTFYCLPHITYFVPEPDSVFYLSRQQQPIAYEKRRDDHLIVKKSIELFPLDN